MTLVQHNLSQHCMTAESACVTRVGSCSQGQKYDFGGIRTHARKTAALTQRLRSLGHEVS